MKKLELRKIIREEINSLLKEKVRTRSVMPWSNINISISPDLDPTPNQKKLIKYAEDYIAKTTGGMEPTEWVDIYEIEINPHNPSNDNGLSYQKGGMKVWYSIVDDNRPRIMKDTKVMDTIIEVPKEMKKYYK